MELGFLCFQRTEKVARRLRETFENLRETCEKSSTFVHELPLLRQVVTIESSGNFCTFSVLRVVKKMLTRTKSGK